MIRRAAGRGLVQSGEALHRCRNARTVNDRPGGGHDIPRRELSPQQNARTCRASADACGAAARDSNNRNDFALVAMLGLLGLRIFEACGANIADLGEEHGHRLLKVRGKGGKVVLTPLPPAVARAVDRAVAGRAEGLDRHPNYILAAHMISGT